MFIVASGFCNLVYSEFNYLLPLHMEDLFAAKGATLFGLLTSTNAIVVVIGTPLITTFLGKIIDVRKFLIGEVLIVTGLVSFTFSGRVIPLYFVLMTVFTLGEIFCTIASAPYMTRRVPSTHWGRISSTINIFCMAFTSLGNIAIGNTVDAFGFRRAWMIVAMVGAVAISLLVILNAADRRSFPLLYVKEENEQ